MPTTTIRLSDELKARVANAAECAGTSAHSFILAAIAEKAEREERRRGFDDVAERMRGYLALYRYIAEIDTVFVLAVRSQSEAGYAER